MALLKTVKPGEAQGLVKETYDMFLKMGPVVPKPLQLLSVSPDLMKIQTGIMGYYMKHPTLSFELLAHIRMLSAHSAGYEFCVNFNGGILSQMASVSEEQIDATLADPSKAALREKDKAMLLFVVKAVKTPEAVSGKDVEALRKIGWTDRDIFDATVHGANMRAASILFKTFKMDED
jgi:alkylhydroperoxidase family enzyme